MKLLKLAYLTVFPLFVVSLAAFGQVEVKCERGLPELPTDARVNLLWAKQGGYPRSHISSIKEKAVGVDVDNDANIYVVGNSTTYKINNNKGNYFNVSFLSKYDKDGKLVLDKETEPESNGISVIGETGEVYTFGGSPAYKYGLDYRDKDLDIYWSPRLSDEVVTGMRVHGDYVYITGYTSDRKSYFVAKYAHKARSLVWHKQVRGSESNSRNTKGYTVGTAISVDSGGNIYVAGNTNVDVSGQKINVPFDDPRNNNDYKESYFIAKYDPNGRLMWTKRVGARTVGNTAGTSEASGISVYGDDKGTTTVYVAGSTSGILRDNSLGDSDFFIARYDADGNQQNTIQGGYYSVAFKTTGLTVDPKGNVYIVGYTNSGNAIRDNQPGFRSFILKFNPDGEYDWGQKLGSSGGNTRATGISGDSNGNLYVTGVTSVGIAGNKMIGYNDYFIAKYGPARIGNKCDKRREHPMFSR